MMFRGDKNAYPNLTQNVTWYAYVSILGILSVPCPVLLTGGPATANIKHEVCF